MHELDFEIAVQENKQSQETAHEYAFNEQMKKDLAGQLNINFLDDLSILDQTGDF